MGYTQPLAFLLCAISQTHSTALCGVANGICSYFFSSILIYISTLLANCFDTGDIGDGVCATHTQLHQSGNKIIVSVINK